MKSAHLTFALTFFLGVAAAAADDVGSPAVCVGYRPDLKMWGEPIVLGDVDFDCPTGYAIMGGAGAGTRSKLRERELVFDADCCPLPRGMLTGTSVYARGLCPPDSVVTGFAYKDDAEGRRYQARRCTELDHRFRLAPAAKGVTLGIEPGTLLGASIGKPDFVVSRSQLPPALRYGIGRINVLEWTTWRCIGSPAGSLLVGSDGPDCSGMLFAEVLLRDSAASTAVATYPACRTIDSPFSTEPRCLGPAREQGSD